MSGIEVESQAGASVPIQTVANNTVSRTFKSANFIVRAAVAADRETKDALLLKLFLEDSRPLEQMNLPVRTSDLPQISTHRVIGTWVIPRGKLVELHRFERVGNGSTRSWTVAAIGTWETADGSGLPSPKEFRRHPTSVVANYKIGSQVQERFRTTALLGVSDMPSSVAASYRTGAQLQERLQTNALLASNDPTIQIHSNALEFTHGRQMPVTTTSNNTETTTYRDAADTLRIGIDSGQVTVYFSRSRIGVSADATSAKPSPNIAADEVAWAAGLTPLNFRGMVWLSQSGNVANHLVFEELKVGAPQ